MRRPTTALTTAILGTVLLVPDLPAQQPPSTSSTTAPVSSGRSARYLLKNGWDYITYQEYERALAFFREAEGRKAELSKAEVESLAQGINQAQAGLREASNSSSTRSYARSGRTRPGALAFAGPNGNGNGNGSPSASDRTNANLASSRSRGQGQGPTSLPPPPEPEPIQLTSNHATTPAAEAAAVTLATAAVNRPAAAVGPARAGRGRGAALAPRRDRYAQPVAGKPVGIGRSDRAAGPRDPDRAGPGPNTRTGPGPGPNTRTRIGPDAAAGRSCAGPGSCSHGHAGARGSARVITRSDRASGSGS